MVRTVPQGRDPLLIEGPLGKGRIILSLARGLPWSLGTTLLAEARGKPLAAGERLLPGAPSWGTMALAALDGKAVACLGGQPERSLPTSLLASAAQVGVPALAGWEQGVRKRSRLKAGLQRRVVRSPLPPKPEKRATQ